MFLSIVDSVVAPSPWPAVTAVPPDWEWSQYHGLGDAATAAWWYSLVTNLLLLSGHSLVLSGHLLLLSGHLVLLSGQLLLLSGHSLLLSGQSAGSIPVWCGSHHYSTQPLSVTERELSMSPSPAAPCCCTCVICGHKATFTTTLWSLLTAWLSLQSQSSWLILSWWQCHTSSSWCITPWSTAALLHFDSICWYTLLSSKAAPSNILPTTHCPPSSCRTAWERGAVMSAVHLYHCPVSVTIAAVLHGQYIDSAHSIQWGQCGIV